MSNYYDLATIFGGRVFFYTEDIRYVMFSPAENSAIFGQNEARVQLKLKEGSTFYLSPTDPEVGNVYVDIIKSLKELND